MAKDKREVQKLPSKRHSCSELEKGHAALMAVKHEGDDPEVFDQKIKDSQKYILFFVVATSST